MKINKFMLKFKRKFIRDENSFKNFIGNNPNTITTNLDNKDKYAIITKENYEIAYALDAIK